MCMRPRGASLLTSGACLLAHADGLDMRWTPAKAKMWRARFAAAGVARTHVEVWHEDGSRRGDEEWEEHLSAHLSWFTCGLCARRWQQKLVGCCV